MYAPSKMRKNQQHRGELAIIDGIRRRFTGRSTSVRLGIGDDCAILRPPPGSEILVTTDFSLEGRHFRRDWHSAESAGHRCLARGLSDLAAMGASPVAAFLSLALPVGFEKRWLDGFLEGLGVLAKRYGVPLAGGDTAQSPSDLIFSDIVLIGAAPAGRALRRSGAKAGDVLYVTGALGGAAAELATMQKGGVRRVRSGSNGLHPQMFPEPRIAVGQVLLRRGLATACMDLSDGLSTDLSHLCSESGVGAEVDLAALPLHKLAAKLPREARGHAALHGGEDYELLFTAAPATRVPRQIGGVAITPVGRITRAKAGLILVHAEGERTVLQPAGWEHLRDR